MAKTNRITVVAQAWGTQFTITPNAGRQVTAHFDRVPAWFLNDMKALRDLERFPHVHTVTDTLARVVRDIEIGQARGRVTWADFEPVIAHLVMQAKHGRAWERSDHVCNETCG